MRRPAVAGEFRAADAVRTSRGSFYPSDVADGTAIAPQRFGRGAPQQHRRRDRMWVQPQENRTDGDTDFATIEMSNAGINLNNPDDIATYRGLFTTLDNAACIVEAIAFVTDILVEVARRLTTARPSS